LNVFEIIHRPAELEGAAAAFWDGYATQLVRIGSLTMATRPLLAELAALHARMIEINAFLDAHGLFYWRGSVMCTRKEARERSRVMRKMDRLMNKLGMSPLARAELKRKGKLRPMGREKTRISKRDCAKTLTPAGPGSPWREGSDPLPPPAA